MSRKSAAVSILGEDKRRLDTAERSRINILLQTLSGNG